jgi:U3 small nucleolar ribonucleoprotein component
MKLKSYRGAKHIYSSSMTVTIAQLVLRHIEEEKFLDAIQCVQNAILEIEVQPEIAGSDRRKIKSLNSIIDKLSEAAMYGSEWDEGVRAKKAAIVKLQKVCAA